MNSTGSTVTEPRPMTYRVTTVIAGGDAVEELEDEAVSVLPLEVHPVVAQSTIAISARYFQCQGVSVDLLSRTGHGKSIKTLD